MTDSNAVACERALELMPDFWHDGLAGRDDERAWLSRHLETCADCAEVNRVWHQLGHLPAEEPGPKVRSHFDSFLAEAKSADTPALLRRIRPAVAWAAAAALVAALGLGAAGGWWLRGRSMPSSNRSAAQADTNAEIAALQAEVESTRQLAVLSLMQQQSASDRLQGVLDSNALPVGDGTMAAVLEHTLKFDPSPDVRLAALDALVRRAQPPAAAQKLTQAFPYQNSPLVQIALVDELLRVHDDAAHHLLDRVSHDAQYQTEVRERAAWALKQPVWN